MSNITNDFDNIAVASAITNLNAALAITDDTEVDYLVRLAMLQLTVEFCNNKQMQFEAADELTAYEGGNQ